MTEKGSRRKIAKQILRIYKASPTILHNVLSMNNRCMIISMLMYPRKPAALLLTCVYNYHPLITPFVFGFTLVLLPLAYLPLISGGTFSSSSEELLLSSLSEWLFNNPFDFVVGCEAVPGLLGCADLPARSKEVSRLDNVGIGIWTCWEATRRVGRGRMMGMVEASSSSEESFADWPSSSPCSVLSTACSSSSSSTMGDVARRSLREVCRCVSIGRLESISGYRCVARLCEPCEANSGLFLTRDDRRMVEVDSPASEMNSGTPDGIGKEDSSWSIWEELWTCTAFGVD